MAGSLGNKNKLQRLADAGANFAAVTCQAHLAALEQVGHSGDGFAIILAVRTDGEDEVTEAVVIRASGFLEILFHRWRRFWIGESVLSSGCATLIYEYEIDA